MAGILDLDDPQTQMWLGMASGLLQAGGPSPTPVGLGQALGMGLQSGLGQYQIAQKNQQENELRRAKVGSLQAQEQRQQMLGRLMQDDQSAAPSGSQSPADGFRIKGQRLLQAGFLKEGGDLIEAANKLDNNLEFKDGVWYDRRSGKPVSGGAGINPQGFGYQTNIGPGGQISMGVLPGAAGVYGTQQRIGEQARAERDLVPVPSSAPGQPPRLVPRESIVQAGGVAAGMSPAAAAEQAANAAQQADISKNFGTIYNNLQNASMENPGRIAKYQRIGQLLDGIEGGKLSETGKDIASAANAAGIKIDAKLPNKEAAAAIANEIALELRSPAGGAGMPGAMSDQDREFLKSMTPQLAQTNEGRKQIIEARVKLMERESLVANMARRYRKKHGKMDDGFFDQLQDWSDKYPIFK